MIKKKSRRRDGGGDDDADNGFAQWGGYMAAKIAKLEGQFLKNVNKEEGKKSDIFNGVAIFVNGYTSPTADQLKQIMMLHGGVYCHYESRHTTHIIASNLPDCKVKQLKTLNVVKPEWIVDSLKSGTLLDYKKYLLYSNNSKSQPKLNFPALNVSTGSLIKHSRITSSKDTIKVADTKEEACEEENHESSSDSLFEQNLCSQRSLQNCLTEEDNEPLQFGKELPSKSDFENISDQKMPEVSGIVSKCLESSESESHKFMHKYTSDQHPSRNNVANDARMTTKQKETPGQGKQNICSAEINNNKELKNVTKVSVDHESFSKYPEIGDVHSDIAHNKKSSVQKDLSLTPVCEPNLCENTEMKEEESSRICSDSCDSKVEKSERKVTYRSIQPASPCSSSFVNDSAVPSTSGKYLSPEKQQDKISHKKNYSDSPKFKTSVDSKRTAVNPEFLSEFYGNSRLHHLSTMGATFKEYVAKLRDQNPRIFPGLKRLTEWKKCHSLPGKVGDDDDFPNDDLVNNSETSLTSSKNCNRTIMHVDMDCFFVSVGLRSRPELRDVPVAVTHAKKNVSLEKEGRNLQFEKEFYKQRFEKRVQKHSAKTSDCEIPKVSRIDNVCETDSLAEIASCNYEARKAGVKNGMFFGSAIKLCPNLKTIPYDFEGYKEVSYKLYDILASYTLNIEAVSCDEMYVDCSELLKTCGTTALEFASFLRKEIQTSTGCCASVGIGSNPLQARLATKKAKPNGQFHLMPHEVERFMLEIAVKDLPGVGSSLASRLHSEGIFSCRDLQRMPLSSLQKHFGQKTGQALHRHARGEDNRPLDTCHKRKSVSAEVNYGIRFTTQTEAEDFLRRLSKEVSERLQKIQSKARVLTLKLMVRAKDAPVETAKYMGHGACDAFSRSTTFGIPTDDPNIIFREAAALEKQFKVAPNDLRGVGIQMTRLTNVPVKNNLLTNFLVQGKSAGKETSGTNLGKMRDMEMEDGKNKTKEEYSNNINTYKGLKKVDSKSEQVAKIKEDFTGGSVEKKELPKPEDCNFRMEKEVPRKILNYSSHETVKNLPLIDPPNKMPSVPLAEARKMVQMWILQEAFPLECDVLMIASYLQRLIVSHRLEDVDCLFSLMHRLLVHRNKEWKTAYQNIVKFVQEIMQAMFGSELKVPVF